VNMARQISVLFLCLGNICRSPMAEIVMRDLVSMDPIFSKLPIKWVVDSAGTSNEHEGDEPDHRTIQICRQRLGQARMPSPLHRARQLQTADFDRFDYILGMDSRNVRGATSIAKRLSEPARAKLALLCSYDPQATTEVPDPYYGGLDGFNQIYDQITRSLRVFIERVSSVAQ